MENKRKRNGEERLAAAVDVLSLLGSNITLIAFVKIACHVLCSTQGKHTQFWKIHSRYRLPECCHYEGCCLSKAILQKLVARKFHLPKDASGRNEIKA